MLRNRKGVTLIEIMTVVVMVILVTAVSFPKLKDTKRAASMQSARTQVESYLAVARSVAIRNGVRAFLIRQNNTMRIMADSTDGLVTVVPKINLKEVSQIDLSSTVGGNADTIIYDNRGIAVNLPAGGIKFILTVANGYGAGTADTVCVTRLGLVLDKKCGLAVVVPEKEEELPPEEECCVIIDPKTGEIIMPPPPDDAK